jgi:hypothetical protein
VPNPSERVGRRDSLTADDVPEAGLAADEKKESAAIDSHLERTRVEEKHVREAAARGLTSTK